MTESVSRTTHGVISQKTTAFDTTQFLSVGRQIDGTVDEVAARQLHLHDEG
jgi:hypothetical protein